MSDAGGPTNKSGADSGGLSGFWVGTFWYPDVGISTPFNAYFVDNDGVLTGTTLEPNTFADPSYQELSARVDGDCGANSVEFLKIYDPVPGGHELPIAYMGALNESKTVIEGSWVLPDLFDTQGNFRLIRATGSLAVLRAETEVADKND